jgi:hypothetical protein
VVVEREPPERVGQDPPRRPRGEACGGPREARAAGGVGESGLGVHGSLPSQIARTRAKNVGGRRLRSAGCRGPATVLESPTDEVHPAPRRPGARPPLAQPARAHRLPRPERHVLAGAPRRGIASRRAHPLLRRALARGGRRADRRRHQGRRRRSDPRARAHRGHRQPGGELAARHRASRGRRAPGVRLLSEARRRGHRPPREARRDPRARGRGKGDPGRCPGRRGIPPAPRGRGAELASRRCGSSSRSGWIP